jgi:hypothetical protein
MGGAGMTGNEQLLKRTSGSGRRGAVFAFAGVTALALASTAFGQQGFVPAGETPAGVTIDKLIPSSFPFYEELCGSGDRPFVLGFAAQNEAFNQKTNEEPLGVAAFYCKAGANAPTKIVSTLPNSELVDAGNLAGWRWQFGDDFGAVFSKTTVSNDIRQPVTVCVGAQCVVTTDEDDVQTNTCPEETADGPLFPVKRQETLLNALQRLLSNGKVDYAWRLDFGDNKDFPGATNDPAKIALYVRDPSFTCAVGPMEGAAAVNLLDQAIVAFLTDKTCWYKSGKGRYVPYTC